MPFTYILECNDGTYDVGSTTDLNRRLIQHGEGAGAHYTARRRPVRLVWSAEFDSVRDAFMLEKKLQGWSHRKKKALIEGRFSDLPTLSQSRDAAAQ